MSSGVDQNDIKVSCTLKIGYPFAVLHFEHCLIDMGACWNEYSPGGVTLHMTGYAPACIKSVEKGRFLDIQRRRRLLQKGYTFR